MYEHFPANCPKSALGKFPFNRSNLRSWYFCRIMRMTKRHTVALIAWLIGGSLKLQFLTVSHFSTWFSERSGSGFENGFPPSKILKNKWVVQKSLMGPQKWIFHHISRWLSTNLMIFNFQIFSPIFENPVTKESFVNGI